MMDTGFGTAAALQLFATLETRHWSTEFFGALLHTDGILANPTFTATSVLRSRTVPASTPRSTSAGRFSD